MAYRRRYGGFRRRSYGRGYGRMRRYSGGYGRRTTYGARRRPYRRMYLGGRYF